MRPLILSIAIPIWIAGPCQAGLITLVDFNGTDGSSPHGGLLITPQGVLIGTTAKSGANGYGMVYSYDPGSSNLTTPASFGGTSGSYPTGHIFQDSQGNLYGSNENGAPGGQGTIWRMNVADNSITTLYTFNQSNGAYPGGVIPDGNGNLYGATVSGGPGNSGVIYKTNMGTGATTQYSINSAPATTGYDANPGLVMDSNGILYGTNSNGPGSNSGTAFSYNTSTLNQSQLVLFSGTKGTAPMSGLVIDSAGNLYGTTTGGGANGKGTVFKLSAGTRQFSTLYSFTGPDGNSPESLVLGPDGNLYGSTTLGTGIYGSIFEINLQSNAFTLLATFSLSNGSDPLGDLVFDSQGDIFGTTFGGGTYSDGTLFEITNTVPEPGSLLLGSLIVPLVFARKRWKS